MDEVLPARLGEFRIRREIGRGGMGSVYEAYQESMRRIVALKILDGGLQASTDAVTRFEREAWIGGRLNHPNIVKVYGQGSVGSVHFIAMELIDGTSLDAVIRDAKNDAERDEVFASNWRTGRIRQIVELFLGVADALTHVHRQGIVHRDIKPANLLLTQDRSRLLLTDFGLAREEGASLLTRRGDFLGTIRYMSPEQLLAQRVKVDFRSDIYSLGVALYEAVTLDLPYEAEGMEAYISAVATKPPLPARRRNRRVPAELETVLMKCLEKDRELRFGSADELRDDLNRLLQARPVQARRPSFALKTVRFIARHRLPLTATALATVMVAASAGVWLGKVQRDQARSKATMAGFERVLAHIEAKGTTAFESSKIVTQDWEPFRRALLSGSLPPEIKTRFARAFLEPDIRVSAFVDRNADTTVVASIERTKLGLTAVIEPTILVDDAKLSAESPLPPPETLTMLEPEELKRLPLGRHKLELELRAWFFDPEEIRGFNGAERGSAATAAPPTESPQPVGSWNFWEPRWIMGTDASERYVYGPDYVSWNEFWPRLRSRAHWIETGPIQFPPKEFQIVDKLPPNYPTPVRAPDLDELIRKDLRIEKFYSTGRDAMICYFVTTSSALPAAVAGTVEFETADGVRLATAPLALFQGAEANFSTCASINWGDVERTVGSRALITRERLLNDEGVRIRARFAAEHKIAAQTQGIDAYWGGSLVFEGTTHIE